MGIMGLLAITWLATVPFAAAEDADLVHVNGILRRMDCGSLELVIDGVRFAVSADAKVRIAGSHGALSRLRLGMKLAYAWRCRRLAAGRGETCLEILEIEQLPENAPLERS